MNTSHISTTGAFPTGFFLPDEFSYAFFFNAYQIFDHTHAVFDSVAFIELLEPGAGIDWTKIAEFFVFGQLITVFNSAPDATGRFVFIAAATARTNSFFT